MRGETPKSGAAASSQVWVHDAMAASTAITVQRGLPLTSGTLEQEERRGQNEGGRERRNSRSRALESTSAQPVARKGRRVTPLYHATPDRYGYLRIERAYRVGPGERGVVEVVQTKSLSCLRARVSLRPPRHRPLPPGDHHLDVSTDLQDHSLDVFAEIRVG
jgi:hypothetical protein